MLVEDQLELADPVRELIVDLVGIVFDPLGDELGRSFLLEIEEKVTRHVISGKMVCSAGKPTY